MKKCIICGRELEDGAQLCSVCGARQEPVTEAPAEEVSIPEEVLPEAVPEETQTPVPTGLARSEKRPKKVYIFGAAVLTLLILAAILLPKLLLSGPEQAAADYEAVLNGDHSKIEKMWPEAYWQLQCGDTKTKEALLAEARKALAKQQANMRKYYGSDGSTSLKILEEQAVDRETMQTLRDGLAQFGIPSGSVTAARNVTVWQTWQGENRTNDSVMRITAVKIGSGWYLVNVHEELTAMPVSFLFSYSYINEYFSSRPVDENP